MTDDEAKAEAWTDLAIMVERLSGLLQERESGRALERWHEEVANLLDGIVRWRKHEQLAAANASERVTR